METEAGDSRLRFARLRRLYSRLRWWDGVFLVAVVGISLARFAILRRGGVPPTIDAGNWLAFADGMFGGDTRPSSMAYPPIVPILTDLAVRAFGFTDGVSLVAAISSAAPALGLYATLRYLRMGFGALVGSLLLLGASSIGETTAWGGFPQLLGFGLTPVTLLVVDRWLRTWSWRTALAVGALFAHIMAISHFVAATVGIAIGVMMLMALVAPLGPRTNWRRELLQLGLIGAMLLPLLPVYLLLSAILSGPPESFLSSYLLTWPDIPNEIEFLYRAFPFLWRLIVSVVVVTPVLSWGQRNHPVWRMMVSLLAGIVIATAVVREARFLYFLTLLGALVVSFWTDRARLALQTVELSGWLRRLRPQYVRTGLAIMLLAVCGWQLRAGMDFFGPQREHYGLLTPGLVSAIEYVDAESAPGEVLAIPSLNDSPVGWWVEAMTGDRVIFGSPLRWLAYDDELSRARTANEIFAPGFPTAERMELARQQGIRFILVPRNWTFYDADAIELLETESPGTIVVSNDDAVVLELG